MRKSDGTLIKLEVSNCEKDVGVYIDEHLTFEKHIVTKVNKANSTMGLIGRSLAYLNEEMFVLLFKALLRTWNMPSQCGARIKKKHQQMI